MLRKGKIPLAKLTNTLGRGNVEISLGYYRHHQPYEKKPFAEGYSLWIHGEEPAPWKKVTFGPATAKDDLNFEEISPGIWGLDFSPVFYNLDYPDESHDEKSYKEYVVMPSERIARWIVNKHELGVVSLDEVLRRLEE